MRSDTPPVRPVIPAPILDNIPLTMREWNHWVYWRWELREGGWAKVPRTTMPVVNGAAGNGFERARSNDPSTWREFEPVALDLTLWEEAGAGGRMGLGYVISDGDPFTVIDLDGCREAGRLTDHAAAVVARFNSYTEVSPSGKGVKIFVRGKTPGPRTRTKDRPGIEVYSRVRFCALTGDRLPGLPAEPQCRQAELDAFYAELFPTEPPAAPAAPRRSCHPATPPPPPASPPSLSDLEVIERARSARNGDRFERLWNGDPSGQNGDRSAADFALASMLAFWVGPDVNRVVSLMRQSGLRRPKWDRPGYLTRTAERAVAGRTTFWIGDRPEVARRTGACRPCPSDSVVGVDAPSQTDEEAVARASAEARRDQRAYPCCRPRNQLLRDRDDGSPHLACVRCEDWNCPGCRLWLIFRHLQNARLRFNQAKALYQLWCPFGREEAVRKQIGQTGGRYYRVRDVAGFLFVTDKAVPGASLVATEDALAKVDRLLNAWRGDRKKESPVSTSRGKGRFWGLPKPRPSGQYEHVAQCDPHLDPTRIQEIAEAARLQARGSIPQGGAGRIALWWAFGPPRPRNADGDYRWPGSEAQFRYLRDMLLAGEVLPANANVETEDEPWAPPEDDAVEHAYALWADA